MASLLNVPVDCGKDGYCFLCKEPYRDPRLLPCLHAFCFNCLQKQLEDPTEKQAALLCPTCLEQTPLRIDDLPSHIYLHNQASIVRRVVELQKAGECENCDGEGEAVAFCPDCGEGGLRICEQCVECHKRFKSYNKHKLVSLNSDLRVFARKQIDKDSMVCAKHGNVALKFFCQTCEGLACSECSLSDHCGHEFEEVTLVLDNKKAEIQLACSTLEQAPPSLSQAEIVLKNVMNDIDDNNAQVKREIEDAFVAISAVVEERRQELLANAEAMTVAKKTRLTMQQEGLEKLNVAMKLTVDSVHNSTQSYTAPEFLAIHPVLKNSCSDLERQFANTSLDPVANATMVARVRIADVITAIGSIGSVEEALPCSPSHSSLLSINDKLPIGITMGTSCTLIVQTHNSRGEPVETGKVRAWVTTQSGKRVCDADISSSRKGKYAATFCVQEECSAKAYFTANGEHINGSPFDIIVRDYAQVQEPVLSFQTSTGPKYLYVSRSNGDIYVTLKGGDVCIYSSQGVLKSTIAGSGLGVADPFGIVLDEGIEVMYITCYKSNKLVKAKLDGKLISSIGGHGSDQLKFDHPMGLCLDTSSNVYVADLGNKRVQVLGPDLVFQKEFKCQGRARGVAVDSFGTLHVATTSGMEIFPAKLESFSNKGSCSDAAVSQDGLKFITYNQCNEARLEILKPDYDLLKTIHELRDPIGVFSDQSGYIYIADYGTKKLLKY